MYLSQSNIIRNLLSMLYTQATNVEDSDIPIYVNYSVPYYEIDNKRIIVYDINSTAPENFLGNREIIRTQGFSIVVSDKDSQTAYDRVNSIMEFLEGQDASDDFIDIDAVSDIEYLGINAKKYYLYKCDFLIRRTK